MTISSLFFERLKEARKELGLNQADVADLVGVTREHWGRCERGDAVPGGEVLAALANAGADVRYILTGQRDFEPPRKLTSEEETMLEYFGQADKEARKAALRALLSAATPTPSATPKAKSSIHVGVHNGQRIEGDMTVHGPQYFGTLPPRTKPK